MAIRWAVASGNWSNTATWDGGTLPTSADDVFANNFTVTVDQDITVITLRNTSNTSPAITQGGSFVVSGSTGTRNITLTGTRQSVSFNNSGLWQASSTLTLFNVTATSGFTLNLSSPAASPNTGVGFLVTINGNCTINYSGVMNQNPSFFTQFVANAPASNGNLTIVGNPVGTPNGNSVVHILAPGYTLNVVGNVTAGGGIAVLLQQAATVNITGNVTAAGANAIEWNGGSGGVVNVTGNVTAATGAGIFNNSTSQTIVINGNVTASSSNNGIIGNTIGTIVRVNGNLTNVNDCMAVFAIKMRISPTTQQTWTFQTGSGNRQLSTSNVFSGYPSVSDVRSGVVYASGSLTGTCNVPAAASVAFGVPVDNTTGTAIITRAQLISDVGAIVAAYIV